MNDELRRQLHACLPEDVPVTIVAGRGFGDIARYPFFREGPESDYVIRMEGNSQVTYSRGHAGPISDGLYVNGQANSVKQACMTRQNYPAGQVICVQRPGMKSAWYLAAGQLELSAQTVMKMYGRRLGTKCSFRDIKDYKWPIYTLVLPGDAKGRSC